MFREITFISKVPVSVTDALEKNQILSHLISYND